MELWAVDKQLKIEVSNKGRLKRGSFIFSQRVNSRGYVICSFRVNGKPKTVTVHRLVAIHHCERERGKNIVNHIDGNKMNNDASNLEWCTQSENVLHAYKLGLNWKRDCYKKPIYATDRHGKETYYESLTAATKGTGDAKNTIQRHIARKTQSKRGYFYREAGI